MAATTAAPPAIVFNCDKWADCSCDASGQTCTCGASCGCGSITIDQVKDAMTKACPYSDCSSCGDSCKCGASCTCGGTQQKTKEQWVDWVKTNTPAACQCKSGGTCNCAAGACNCGTGAC